MMRKKIPLFFSALLACATGYSADTAGPNPLSLWAIPPALKQARSEIIQLQSSLATLPCLSDSLQFDAYGYHSDYLPALAELPEKPRWTVDVLFQDYTRPNQIILVPAINRQFDQQQSYGFPRRFRIWNRFPDGHQTLIAEWMDHDCPDPGRLPLSIQLPKNRSNLIRIEVFRGAEESGKELFALDELFAIAGVELERAVGIKVSAEYEALPYWSKEYLIDQKTSLGLPVAPLTPGESESRTGDFSVLFDAVPEQPCVLELDLGTNCLLGWVDLYPAAPPQGILIPGFGFPGKIRLELIKETRTGGRGVALPFRRTWDAGNPGNNLVRFAGFHQEGRWIRFHLSDFPNHNGQPTFALGEIHIYRHSHTYPIQQIQLNGFPACAKGLTHLMTDGKSNGRPVMRLIEWLPQLERRKELRQSLQEKIILIEQLQLRWKHAALTSAALILITLLMAAISVATVAVIQRRRHARILRMKITQDLHDDIGSRLSAIALAATYLRKVSEDLIVRERSGKMERMAREMQVALADVLWFTNSDTDSLQQVITRLAEIAQQTVPPANLKLEQSPMIPDLTTGVLVKRDVMLLFKEMLNNAVKHADASEIRIELLWTKPLLTIRVADNGKGFDVSAARNQQQQRPHLGLNSMERRAKRLAGKFQIDSQLGAGCTATLTIKV